MREEKSSQEKGFKRFFKKRWVYPAVYLASAAIILTGVLWFQNSGEKGNDQLDQAIENPNSQFNEPALEVNSSLENFVMPVKDIDNSVIKMQFYDNDMDKAEQEAAIVVYNNQYHPSTGIAIGTRDDSEFEVIASLSGEVITAKEDALLGNVIEIEHDNGIVTQYQSIKNMKVKAGDMVKQGDVIATAGKSQFNEEAGIHVHFEIRKDGIPVNPIDYIDKPLSALEKVELESADDSGKSDASTEEENASKEEESSTKEDASKEEEPTSAEEDASQEEEPTSSEEDEKSSTEEEEEPKDNESDSSINETETSNS